MTATTRLPLRAAFLAAALACLLLPASALAAEHESQQAYEKQLAAGEIAKARINKKVRHLDLTLKSGQVFVYVYPARSEPAVAAKITARHVPLEVLSPTAASTEAKKVPVHHKLRYIAAGILGAIVIIVLIVLFVDRRRKRFAE
jgi:hypothetical protein